VDECKPLVWGLLDQFHTPQLRRWKAGRPNAADLADAKPAAAAGGLGVSVASAGEEGDAGVHILVNPYFDHFAACMVGKPYAFALIMSAYHVL
jgi:hypothetical protein